MNSLIKLEFESKEVRTLVNEAGNIEWVGKDVALALGYVNPQKAIYKHCNTDGCPKRTLIDSKGRSQTVLCINEPNLYRLIARSKLPSAQAFEKWIFETVLPSIRKHGAYVAPSITAEQIDSLMGQLHNAKIESAHYKRLAELESEAVELWRAKSEYGSISPSNGLPRLQLRCGAWCATRNFNNSLTHDFDQMTFDFNK